MPFSERNMLTLRQIPRRISILLLVVLVISSVAVLLTYYNYELWAVGCLFIGIILNFPLIWAHEHAHALVLRKLNKDKPIVTIGIKSYCSAQKPIPMPIFRLDLLMPLCIPVLLIALLSGLIASGICEMPRLIIGFTAFLSLLTSTNDLYWFYKLRKISKDWYVECNGLTAKVYQKLTA